MAQSSSSGDEDFRVEQCAPIKKTKRGSSLMLDLIRRHREAGTKMTIEFSDTGYPLGKIGDNWRSYLGTVVINDMTSGGADYCFECVGMSSLVQEAFACCRKGWGKTIVIGVDKPMSQLTFSSFEVLHSGQSIIGSFFGCLKAKSDIPILLKRYMDKELNPDDFVTHEISFNDINKAFDLLLKGSCIRCVIWLEK